MAKKRKESKGKKKPIGAVAFESIRELLRVDPATFSLDDHDPDTHVAGPDHQDAALEEVVSLEAEVSELQERMWAAARKTASRARLLLVLQGMDTSGKGGAAKAIHRLFDPAGFASAGFGKPTEEEARHHFLWRYEQVLPQPGRVQLFDRSPYEQVLVVRVHELEPWHMAYHEINAWEASLVKDGMAIVKVMLNVSRDEQKERLLARLDDPTKYWKYNPGDVDERGLWNDYMAAYQDALVRCSQAAPWYVVPANRKWHRDWLLAQIVAETMRDIAPPYPDADFDVEAERARVAAS